MNKFPFIKSLANRITFLVFILGISAAIVNLIIVGTFQYKILKTNINSAVENQVETVYTVMAESIFYQRIYDIFIKTESMKKVFGFVENIYVFDALGNYLTDALVEKDIPVLGSEFTNDNSYRLFEVSLSGNKVGYILYKFKDNYIQGEIYPQLAETGIFGFILLIIGMVLATIANRLITKPLRHLTSQVENSSFDTLPFKFTLSDNAPSEIKTLALKLEDMSVSLKNAFISLGENEKRLQRSNRLASVGTMAAGLAHQLKNPIMTIDLITHIFNSGEPAHKKDISVVRKEAKKIVAILNDFLNISKPVRITKSLINIDDFRDDFTETANARVSGSIVVSFIINSKITLYSDPERLKEILLNLLHNSAEAGADKFLIEIYEKDIYTELAVSDNGQGLSKEAVEKVFMPFFTTKAAGTGLGLTYAEYCLDLMGGSIIYDNTYCNGVKFIIKLDNERI